MLNRFGDIRSAGGNYMIINIKARRNTDLPPIDRLTKWNYRKSPGRGSAVYKYCTVDEISGVSLII